MRGFKIIHIINMVRQMENYNIILKTVLFYLILIIIVRLLGKREVGEVSVFDLVILLDK